MLQRVINNIVTASYIFNLCCQQTTLSIAQPCLYYVINAANLIEFIADLVLVQVQYRPGLWYSN